MRWIVIVTLLLTASPAIAQHLGARVQWQPDTMPADGRLDQPVEIEIIGRAAVPATEMLSERTGVSLGVAPEDLNTVGERKLTIISKGLTLKAIMVQIPEALQEAHWDIDASGEQPVYLLHRNAGVDEAAKERRRQPSAERAGRAAELEYVRQALSLSREELHGLEETDLLLALALEDPFWRGNIEAFFALPEDKMQEIVGRHGTSLRYRDAPEAVKQSVDRILVRCAPPDDHPYAKQWQDSFSHREDAEITYAMLAPGELVMHCTDPFGAQVIVPGRDVGLTDPRSYPYELLVKAGGRSQEEAASITTDWNRRRGRELANRADRRIEELVPAVGSPLHRPYTARSPYMSLADFQSDLSGLTGFTVVSDSFGAGSFYVGEEMRQEVPLWHVLALLSDRGIHWRVAGDCVVFHHRNWYRLQYGMGADAVAAPEAKPAGSQ